MLPYTQAISGPNTLGAQVLGDLVVAGVKKTYVAFGAKLYVLTAAAFPSVAVSDTTKTLDAQPATLGTVFRVSGTSKMFIPLGTTGYQTWDGTTLSALVTTIKPINFMVHSRKLWAVDDAGVIWKSLDGTAWTNVWQLDPGPTIRGITQMDDRSDAPAPHVVTDEGVYVLDEGVPALYETELNYAPHPYAGLAFERWRTDLYVSIGMGVQRYTLGTVNAAGLDRDYGVGRNFAGYISTLRRGFNDLFAGVSATVVAGGVTQQVAVDQGLEVYLGGFSPRCSVMRLTGGQAWHTAWLAPSAGGTISDLYVSTANSDYRLMWGWQGKLYIQQLTTAFDNPRDNPNAYFMPAGS